MIDVIPKQIKFIFRDKMGLVIPRLIVYCRLISKNKNNYSIGPSISNEEGEIIITKELIKNTILQNQIDFPMDYDGYLNDCTHLEILIETRKELENRKIILKEFYPENALLLEEAIINSCSKNIHFDKLFTLPIKEKEILIEMD